LSKGKMNMAFEENGGGMNYSMPVAPAYGGNGFGNGFGGDGWWILLLLLAFGGGWGMGGFGGGWGGMDIYPWLNNSQHISDGFRDQMLNTSVASIGDKVTSGFGDVATQLCGGFAGVNASINGAQNAVTQQMYANQIADMQQNFALQSQLAQCCCDNRLATANLSADLAREACADRASVEGALRDVLTANAANTQKILDTMCQDKIDAKNETIAQLRSELMFARGQASQDVQTAAIQAGQRALANEVEQYVLPTPRPAYIVANPNCCQPNYGCGCGV
jgi:hypothetical protein